MPSQYIIHTNIYHISFSFNCKQPIIEKKIIETAKEEHSSCWRSAQTQGFLARARLARVRKKDCMHSRFRFLAAKA
jgi:hypothetical protein